jgi:hypothetical protein
METPGCHYEILAHNDNGYILSCHGCGHYQLAFGTMVITLLPEDLHHFRRRLQQKKTEMLASWFSNQKIIRMPVGVAQVQMALTTKETDQLLLLIDEAAGAAVFRKLMEEMEWK